MTIPLEHPGIRYVRPLARDAHRESWLVRLDGGETAETGPAVLVRALHAHGASRVRAELAALHRGRGTGLVPLLDVVDDEHGAALLRAHIPGPRVNDVLAERERWAAGEVVMVLRPLVEAIARLHRSGVAHGALSARGFVVATEGAVLVELGDAQLFAAEAPEAALVRTAAVGADRESVRTLAVELLRRTAGARARAARVLADEVEHRAGSELFDMLRSGLDDLASPVPLEAVDADVEVPVTAGGERMLPIVRTATPVAETEAERVSAAPRSLLARISAEGMALLGALRIRLDALPAVRRRAVVAGGAALCAAAVLLALPAGSSETQSAPGHVDAREPSHTPQVSTPEAGPSDAAAASGATDAAIRGDDPLAAALALLDRRTRCFAELSLLCLEEVDQQGSAALALDRAAIVALRAGEEATYPHAELGEARVIERLGAGALIEVGPQTHPASLLLMRSEAGWRIRDWVAVAEN